MPVTPQVSWNERIQHALAIERESDAFYRSYDDEPDNTYWTKDDVEALLAEISQRILRMVPPGEIGMLGADAIVRASFTQGADVPQDLVGIIAATVLRNPGDLLAKPASGPISVAEWYQMSPLSMSRRLTFAIVGGKFVFKGDTLNLFYLREPTLAEFQGDQPVLPPAGYNQLCWDWVHQMLTAADWLPIGRA